MHYGTPKNTQFPDVAVQDAVQAGGARNIDDRSPGSSLGVYFQTALATAVKYPGERQNPPLPGIGSTQRRLNSPVFHVNFSIRRYTCCLRCPERERLMKFSLDAVFRNSQAGGTIADMKSEAWREATRVTRIDCEMALAELNAHRREL